jgi:hypothetical protein
VQKFNEPINIQMKGGNRSELLLALGVVAAMSIISINIHERVSLYKVRALSLVVACHFIYHSPLSRSGEWKHVSKLRAPNSQSDLRHLAAFFSLRLKNVGLWRDPSARLQVMLLVFTSV